MNHEHDNFTPGPAPRHRAEPETSGNEYDTTADAYVADIVANAPTAETGRRITDGYERYGTAFALYLALDGVDKYARDYGPGSNPAEPSTIEDDFKNAYYAHFNDREALIDDTIESFDWGADLDRLLRDHPDLRAMVVFDRDAIWGFVNDHYEVIDGHDGIYVFERWP